MVVVVMVDDDQVASFRGSVSERTPLAQAITSRIELDAQAQADYRYLNQIGARLLNRLQDLSAFKELNASIVRSISYLCAFQKYIATVDLWKIELTS